MSTLLSWLPAALEHLSADMPCRTGLVDLAWRFWSLHFVGLILGFIGLGWYVLFGRAPRLAADHFAVLSFAVLGAWLIAGSLLRVVTVFSGLH